jgi:PilZ domain
MYCPSDLESSKFTSYAERSVSDTTRAGSPQRKQGLTLKPLLALRALRRLWASYFAFVADCRSGDFAIQITSGETAPSISIISSSVPSERALFFESESFMAEQANRRAQERIPVSADVSCTFVSPVVTDFGPAKIKDISMQGIGLLLSKKVDVGTTLAITLTNPAKSLIKTVLIKVAHVTLQPGGALVGGTFNIPLTYQELTMLVM